MAVTCASSVSGFRRKRVSSTPHFLCGAGAAFINIIVTFPAHKLMFRQQVDGLRIGAALKSMKAEGFWGMYRGVAPPLMQKTVSLSVMFGMFAWYKQHLERWHVHQSLVIPLASMLAGSTECILSPFERIQTLLQLPAHARAHHNTIHVARELFPYGIKEYYRGLTSIAIRNAGSSMMFFMLRVPLQDALPGDHEILNSFVTGALLGAIISTVFFPLNVVKSVTQRRVGGKSRGVWQTLQQVMRERNGIGGLYRGVQLNFTRALVSWGVINAGYEVLLDLSVKHGWASPLDVS